MMLHNPRNILGLDGDGWLRNITVNDAAVGLAILQSGAGAGLTIANAGGVKATITAAGKSRWGDAGVPTVSLEAANGFLVAAGSADLVGGLLTNSWRPRVTGNAMAIADSSGATVISIGAGSTTTLRNYGTMQFVPSTYQATVAIGGAIKEVLVTKAHDSDLFNAAALTDSATIWTQPANTVILGIKMVLKTQFAGTGITDIDVTIGLAGDPDGLVAPPAMNLISDAANSQYKTRGAYWDEAAAMGFLFRDAAVDWIAYVIAVGANLNLTSVGSLVFIITYWDLDA